MTKADIVNEIAKSTGAEKVLVQTIVEAFMENVKNSLVENNNVYERFSETHFQRYYSYNDLKRMGEKNGLILENVYGDLNLSHCLFLFCWELVLVGE